MHSFRKGATALAALSLATACSGQSSASPVKTSPSPPAVATTAANSCAAPEAGQFDFWVGSWQGTWTDSAGTLTATDIVLKTGCEIDETFKAPRFLQSTDYSATSRSHWDTSFRMWVQDYSDSARERSRWLGSFANGQMKLAGPQVGSRQQRVIWRDIHPNDWMWEYDSSTDGVSWSAMVVIAYVRVGQPAA